MDFSKPLIIKDIVAENRIWLAPMAEITDRFLRMKAIQFGAGFAFSGMVSVKGLIHNYESTIKKVGNHYENEMFSFQLFGSEAKDFFEATKLVIKRENIKIFDINAGCPVKKVVKTGSGSALILRPEKIYDIVKMLKDNFDITLSVKTRKGWDDSTNSEKLIEYAVKAGVDFISIHPRTREQFYNGDIDLDYALYLKEKFDIPLIMSGNIKNKMDLKSREKFDGVMIGREAFKDIGIFTKLLGKEITINYKDLFLEHLKYYNENYKRIGGFKKFLPVYLEHTNLTKIERNEIYSLKTYEEIEKVVSPRIKS
jgi:tRNA-dihydrouridine synthase B